MEKPHFTTYNPDQHIDPSITKHRFINPQTIIAFIIGVATSLLIVLAVTFLNNSRELTGEPIDYETALDLSAYIDNIDPSWTITSANPDISDITLDLSPDQEDNIMILHFFRTGANDFSFTSPGGETQNFTITIDKDSNISIYRR